MNKQMEKVNSDKHIPAFDGVRGFAVLCVLIYHATMTIYHHSPLLKAILSVMHLGFLGVDIFFALSGFLITGILLDSKHKTSAVFFRTFFIRRSLRIFPLYFGVILLLLLVPQLISSLQGQQYYRFVEKQWWFWTYGANVVREYYGDKNPVLEFGWFGLTHFWTLAIEEHFYLFWPFVIYFFSRKKLIPMALVLLSLSVWLRYAEIPLMSFWVGALSTLKYLGGLLIGSLGAILLRESGVAEALVKLSRVILSVTLLSCFLWLNIYSEVEVVGNNPMFHTLVAIATTSILVMAASKQQNFVTRFFEFRFLRFFGKYSYGIYVYHALLIPLFRSFHFSEWPGGHMAGAISYIVLFCVPPIMIAMLSYHYFELPFLKMKDKFFTKVS